MTTFEALVSVSQTLLRANGRWCVEGIDAILRADIRAMVFDVSHLFRWNGDCDATCEAAIRELERRATPFNLSVDSVESFIDD